MSKLAFLEKIVSRKVNKEVDKATKGMKITNPDTIRKQATAMIKLLNMQPAYASGKARSNLLKDKGLPSDIRKLRKKTNWSDSDIIEFYWKVDAFRELWCEVLSMDRDNWVFCVVTMSRDKDWDRKEEQNNGRNTQAII